ncbi:MAG: penicillin-binding protein 2 [Pseudomonadota bacterium]
MRLVPRSSKRAQGATPVEARPVVVISPGLNHRARGRDQNGGQRKPRLRLRATLSLVAVGAGFMLIAGQLLRLASLHEDAPQAAISKPLATAFSRPDIVDRNGRLLANDVVIPSLYADPSVMLDIDEVAHELSAVIPSLSQAFIREAVQDRSRQFVWLKRGISPSTARAVHELGLPGLAFQYELKRAYPAGRLVGHTLGFVNVDNHGLAGIERFLDETNQTDPVYSPKLSHRKPVQLSLDLSVQHALHDVLGDAKRRYKAEAAAGVVIDVRTGEILAAVSTPGADPLVPQEAETPERADRLRSGVFELGSIFKLFTLADALERKAVTPDMSIDVTRPLVADGHVIRDPHPSPRPLTVSQVFTKSSNVGAGVLALSGGAAAQQAFLAKLGFDKPLRTEAGRGAFPQLPRRWNAIETVTVSYGHGLAVAPLQFAAAAVPIVNGGTRVPLTFFKRPAGWTNTGPRVVSRETVTAMRKMMRANVASKAGTGWRADVPGLDVGGKTGTAEIAVNGRYDPDAVISSFVGAFPMDEPRTLTLLSLFRPQPTRETGGKISAGVTAAPATARLIERIAPLLPTELLRKPAND